MSEPFKCARPGCQASKHKAKGLCHYHYKNSWDQTSPTNFAYQTRASYRFNYLQRRATKRRLPCTLSFEEFEALADKPCFYCGSEEPRRGIGLDRKDNNRGYEPGNVLPCCGPCNQIRGRLLSVREMKLVAGVMSLVKQMAQFDEEQEAA